MSRKSQVFVTHTTNHGILPAKRIWERACHFNVVPSVSVLWKNQQVWALSVRLQKPIMFIHLENISKFSCHTSHKIQPLTVTLDITYYKN